MKAKYYAAKEHTALLYVTIEKGKKEISIGLSDGENKNWNELTLNAKQAAGLRKFLDENNWS